jgi:hypothetical protein
VNGRTRRHRRDGDGEVRKRKNEVKLKHHEKKGKVIKKENKNRTRVGRKRDKLTTTNRVASLGSLPSREKSLTASRKKVSSRPRSFSAPGAEIAEVLAELAKLELGVSGGVFKPEFTCVGIGLRGTSAVLLLFMTSTLTVTVGLGVGALDAGVLLAIGERDGAFEWSLWACRGRDVLVVVAAVPFVVAGLSSAF